MTSKQSLDNVIPPSLAFSSHYSQEVPVMETRNPIQLLAPLSITNVRAAFFCFLTCY